jgi:hypothetical protein
MQAYVCVYRRHLPSKADRKRTQEPAKSDAALSKFLDEYDDSFYDWGDDPAFFAAQFFMSDVQCATWGVCRRDVRQQLKDGDVVVFFCGKPRVGTRRIWDYYYIGLGTVKSTVDRRRLWTEELFTPYRKFYNVLAQLRGKTLIRKETFHPYHKDWERRAQAPYILFESKPDLTHFNVTNPQLVGTYDGSHIPETWNKASIDLKNLIFVERGISRRLRSSQTGFGHTQINLLKSGKVLRPGRNVDELRKALLRISREIAGA